MVEDCDAGLLLGLDAGIFIILAVMLAIEQRKLKHKFVKLTGVASKRKQEVEER